MRSDHEIWFIKLRAFYLLRAWARCKIGFCCSAICGDTWTPNSESTSLRSRVSRRSIIPTSTRQKKLQAWRNWLRLILLANYTMSRRKFARCFFSTAFDVAAIRFKSIPSSVRRVFDSLSKHYVAVEINWTSSTDNAWRCFDIQLTFPISVPRFDK